MRGKRPGTRDRLRQAFAGKWKKALNRQVREGIAKCAKKTNLKLCVLRGTSLRALRLKAFGLARQLGRTGPDSISKTNFIFLKLIFASGSARIAI
jgi:hypothetical protein